MALDFPASPSVNQTYSGPGGVIWVWDGAKWTSGTGSTVYAPVTSPVFLGDPQRSSAPALGDSDSSVPTTQWVQQTVAPAFNNVGRSYIHNPLMRISQRGGGPFTSANSLDRWFLAINTDSMSVTQTLLSDAQRAQIGDEDAWYCLYNTFTGSAVATAFSIVQQKIEQVRRLSGKTVTISFWAAGTAGQKLGVSLDQIFGTGGSPSGAVLVNGTAVTLTATFARYSVTLTLPSIAGKVLGSNFDDCTAVDFWYSSGSNGTVRSGGVGVQSGTTAIWGVQLEIGAVATPLQKPDLRDDYANCQRSYFVSSSIGTSGYALAATHNVTTYIMFPVTMRGYPTVAFNGNGPITNISSVAPNDLTPTGFMFSAMATAGGYAYWNGAMTASADL